MKKNKEKINKTKKDIMDAFWKLYCEKRIDKITVKEISKNAGYNRSTFYEYFIDVYDVLEQIENELIPKIAELPPCSISNIKLGMPLDVFMDLYDKNSEYYVVLLGDKGDPAFATKLKNALKEMLTEALILEMKIDPIELDFTLEFILSAMIATMSHWFKKDKIIPIEQLIKLINNIMGNSIISKLNA